MILFKILDPSYEQKLTIKNNYKHIVESSLYKEISFNDSHIGFCLEKLGYNSSLSEFFLEKNTLYNVSQKMIDIDILSYWSEIIKEGNNGELFNILKINNLENFLSKTSKQIKKSRRDI
jgi:hypothetical protein